MTSSNYYLVKYQD